MSRPELLESVLIVLSVFALIPLALHFWAPWYGAILCLVLIAMAVVFVRRIRRISDIRRHRM